MGLIELGLAIMLSPFLFGGLLFLYELRRF